MDLPVRVSGGNSSRGLNIHITDSISGITILDITLSPEQTYNMLTGHNAWETIPAFVLPPDSYAQKIGKKRYIFQRKFPGHHGSDVAHHPSLAEWGESVRKATGCTSFDWGRHNDGMSFTMRLYSNDLTEAAAAVIRATLADVGTPAVLVK